MKSVLEFEALATLAIKAALSHQWEEAVKLNLEFLADDPESVEASNRLARAYQELSNPAEAKKMYQKVLTLDPYNAIAQKNLDKLAQGTTLSSTTAVNQAVFLEEPGKTRSTLLSQPQAKHLSHLASGAELQLVEKHGRLSVTTKGHLLGYIQDDLGGHLLNLIQLGNTYSAHLMTTSEAPQIFLREVSQSEKASKFISFTRSHGANHAGTIVREGSTNDEGFPLDPGLSEEDAEGWDDNQEDTDADPDDDFNSVSLEAMRDEEEGSLSSMRDEY